MLDDMNLLAQKLGDWLRAKGQPLCEVSQLRPSSGGYSNITLLGSFSKPDGTDAQDVVIRIQPQTAAVYPDCDVSVQYQTMQLLQSSGLPVPSLHGLETDPGVLGAPFFIMGRIAGQVPAENPIYHLQGWLMIWMKRRFASTGLQGLMAWHACHVWTGRLQVLRFFCPPTA